MVSKKSIFIVVVIAYVIGVLFRSGPYDPVLCVLSGRSRGCPTVNLGGSVAPGYEKVKEAFESQFFTGFSKGGQLVIWKNGKEVVNLWGSYGEDGYSEQSLQVVFSSSKVFSQLAIAKLLDQGLISSLYDPVSKYWPEFGKFGKEKITIGDVLRHESGLEKLCSPIPWDSLVNSVNPIVPLDKLIEDSTPYWYATTNRTYHALTRGSIESGIVQRVDPKKRSLGKYFAEEIATPLNIDFYFGIPNHKIPLVARVQEWPIHARLVHYGVPLLTGTMDSTSASILISAIKNISFLKRPMTHIEYADGEVTFIKANEFNRIDAIKAEMPSANGISNANSMSVLLRLIAGYGTVNGVKILKNETVEKLLRITTPEKPEVLTNLKTTFSDGGWAFNTITGLNDFYGWQGFGGSIAQFSPKKNAVYAFSMNGLSPYWTDPRTVAVLNALPHDF